MRKIFKALISVMLCLALILSASSCDLVERVKWLFGDKAEEPQKPERVVVEVPEGYTGGSMYAYPKYYEIYWFETVAEAKDAISRLEAHGSTVYKSALLDYSSEDYDVKVMLKIDRTYVEPLKDGQNPFDRKAEKVYVDWFLFDEYISIDELVYINAEDVCMLHDLAISVEGEKCKIDNTNLLTIDHGLPEFGLDWPDNVAPPTRYYIYYQDELIMSCEINEPDDILPEEHALEMLKGATIVGNMENDWFQSGWIPEEYVGWESYWFETYDELLSALEVLRAHDSTIVPTYVFDCEGMMFTGTPLDCKYEITFKTNNAEPLQEGRGFFERKIVNVSVHWYAFNRYYNTAGRGLEMYNVLSSNAWNDVATIDDEALLTISYDFPHSGLEISDGVRPVLYAISYNGNYIGDVYICDGNYNPGLTDYPPPEFALEFVKTIRYIH